MSVIPCPAPQPLRLLEDPPYLFYLISSQPLIASHSPSAGFLSILSCLPTLPSCSFFTTKLSIFNLRFPLTSHCPVGTGWGCLCAGRAGRAGRAGGVGLASEAAICVSHCWAQPCPHPCPSLLSCPLSASGVNTLQQLRAEALETAQGTQGAEHPPPPRAML